MTEIFPSRFYPDEQEDETDTSVWSKTYCKWFLISSIVTYLTLISTPLIIGCDVTFGEGYLYSHHSYHFAWLWITLFVGLTLVLTGLLIHRRNRHPLKARTPAMLCISAVGAVGMSTWTVLDQLHVNLNCIEAHWMQNIFYPMFIFPYFFRAKRVVIIFSQARRFHRQTLVKSERQNQARRNAYGSFIEDSHNKDYEKLALSIPSLSSRSSDSLLQINEETTSLDFEDYQCEKMKEAVTDWANQSMLLLWFGISMIPFIIISIIDSILNGETHLLPSISADDCDMETKRMKAMTISFWICIHIAEASVFAYYYRKLSTVLKEFHTRQEFALIFFAEIFYTTIFVALLVMKLNTENINHAVDFVVMSRSALFMCVTILWPTYSTYFGTEAPMFPNRSVLKSLNNVLEDPLALKYFYNYLQNDQTSLTLLQFWMEVDMFKENAHEVVEISEAYGSARKLFFTYFHSVTGDIPIFKTKSESKTQREIMMRIIPRKIVNDMLAEIIRCENEGSSCSDELFEDAKFIAFQGLKNVYRLFLRSRECKNLLYHLNGQELLFKALIESKVI